MHQRYSDHFLNERLHRVWNKIYTDICPLNFEIWRTKEPVPFKDRMTGEKLNINIGDKWGELWDCAWFHITGKVPEEAAGKNIVLFIDISGEGCVFTSDGKAVEAIAAAHEREDNLGKYCKRIIPVTECARGGEEIDLWIDAGCHSLFGHYMDDGKIKRLHITEFNYELNQFYFDMIVLRQLMNELPENSARRKSIYYSIIDAATLLIRYDQDEIKAARAILAKELNKKGGDPSLTLTAIGHAHLDLAWLWPIRETKRKGARTFATALRNIERYPDYIFGASQAQLYEWVKNEYPDIYEGVKEAVKNGRWEVQGGMWVEADTNVSGGEALVRQFLYGKRFFMKEFGLDMRMLWLPDVFGYNGNLPQIMKKSGVDYFMTIKLSWSTVNKFPYHTFNWKGIDGSVVLTHMAPAGDYNTGANPHSILFSERNYCELGKVDEALLIYGCGDGGGGPSEGHLEALKREKDLSGMPRVIQGHAIDLFDRLAKNSDKYSEWVGELYLEKHQGTYTTHARNKFYNRKMELALRELEFAASMAHTLLGYPYPQAEIDQLWKNVLLYQFHDILPGSSIKRVYDESVPHYMEMYSRTQELINDAYAALAGAMADTGSGADSKVSSGSGVVFNSLSWDREGWVKNSSGWFKVSVPALGCTPIIAGSADDASLADSSLKAAGNVIENENLIVTFGSDGNVVSVYDKNTGYEAIKAGEKANRLTVYNDDLDAWDFFPNYRQEVFGDFSLDSIKFYVDGPQAIAESVWSFGNSKLTQKAVLESGSRRVDFVTEVDWHECNKMLRVGFPLNVTSDRVISEIPFGSIARSTHTNTSWDDAQYEICAHKWIDISQENYGVAILNDSKYGHSAACDYIDINLLRSSTRPGEAADQGKHFFTYSIYPHQGNQNAAEVTKEAYELNVPLFVVEGSDKPVIAVSSSLISVSGDSIIIDTVKKAEDDDDVIVRAYEYTGIPGSGEFSFGFDIDKVWLVNMMEETICELPVVDNKVFLDFGRFEVNTIKVRVKK